MLSNAKFPAALLFAAPGISELETLHLITALQEFQMHELTDATPEAEALPPTTSEGEFPMARMMSTLREIAVPAAIFASFFALPMYTYAAITA